MLLIQFKRYLAFIRLVILTLFAMTSGLLPEAASAEPANSGFLERLNKFYSDKNLPLPNLSTPQSDLENVKKYQQEKVQNFNQNSLHEGGVSDGGGNAIGGTLFDFYENEGSVSLSADKLIELEPLVKKVLETAKKSVPLTDGPIGENFGEMLRLSLRDKKIFLETKNINSSGCINQSLVSSSSQIPVACQSDEEVRFHLPWLMAATPVNRAGLIIHEMILAVARGRNWMLKLDKSVLEARVRALNRALFTEHSGVDSKLSTLLEDLFQIPALNAQEARILRSTRPRALEKLGQYCRGQQVPWEEEFKDVKDRLFKFENFRLFIPIFLKGILGGYNEGLEKECIQLEVDNLPVRPPRKRMLSRDCLEDLQRASELYSSSYAHTMSRYQGEIRKVSINLFTGGVDIAARHCAYDVDNSAEVYSEALNFIRYQLQNLKVPISFKSIL